MHIYDIEKLWMQCEDKRSVLEFKTYMIASNEFVIVNIPETYKEKLNNFDFSVSQLLTEQTIIRYFSDLSYDFFIDENDEE